jgi:integrase
LTERPPKRPRRPRALSTAVRVYKRSGSETYYAAWRDPRTRRLEKRSLGTTDSIVAEVRASRLRQDVQIQHNDHNAIRWLDASDLYMGTIKRPETRRTWQRCIARWVETFGDSWDPWLHEITPDVVARHVDRRRRQGAADATIRLELSFMSALFGFSRFEDARNPVRAYGLRRVKRPREVIRWLTHEEEAALLAACFSEVHRRMIAFAIETGLRKSEQFTLRPHQLNLERRSVWIPPERSKSGRGRTVFLSERALKAVRGHYAPDDDVVFKTPRSGKGFDPQKGAPGWWNRIREKAGVNVRWHDLRHTFASRWVMAGGDLVSLQKLMGHSTIIMTMRYAHLNDESLRIQVLAMGAKKCEMTLGNNR